MTLKTFKRLPVFQLLSAMPRIRVAFTTIVFPLKWLEIAQIIGSAKGNGHNMIDFPAVF